MQPQKVKKIPLRKCVVTNEQHPKMEMFRVVRTPDGSIVIDLTGKVRGHGAYLTKSTSVILTSQKKKILDRHLEAEVPSSIYEEMLELVNNKGNKVE